jgi:NADH dehydrogenase
MSAAAYEGMTREDRRPHVVIVGGGFGGLQVARRLSDRRARITLIDRENHHLFQPLLYQVATAALTAPDIAMPIRSILRGKRGAEVVLGEVAGVDLERRHVALAGGRRYRYDYLVLAAGARTNYFDNEHFIHHTYGLKDLRDALRLRERVLCTFELAELEADPARRRALLTFVVVGGGPTGVEMAGALAELGRHVLSRDFRHVQPGDVRVVLLEMLDRVLPMFHPELSRRAAEQLVELGVEVRIGTRVEDIDEGRVRTSAGDIPCGVALWAPGLRPVPLAASLGVPTRQGKVIVDPTLALPRHPEVFVIGDMAFCVPEGARTALPGLAAVAMQQGKHVAATIDAELRGRARRPFRYRDRGIMATIGRARAVAERGRLRISGFIAWLAWLGVHLVLLVGFRNRVSVFLEWCWAYLTFRRGARIITGLEAPVGEGAPALPRAAPAELSDSAAPR